MTDNTEYRVADLARLAGVTVRTLHHYDEIGLLVPAGRTGKGYRIYGKAEVLRLQQILLYRELEVPLEKIRQILTDPEFDPRRALREQRERLLRRADRTRALLRSVDRALKTLEGEDIVNARELFDGFDPAEYEEEARERWGETDAWRESARRTATYSPADWKRVKTETDELLGRFAAALGRGVSPDSPEAMDLAEEHRLQIDRWYYPCSREMHAGLARMYVDDPRFAASFERHGEGLATFVSESILANRGRAG